MAERAFHLAFPVRDLGETIAFYHGLLGCPLGRQATRWVDFNFFGNQISAHVSPGDCNGAATSQVDGDKVPARHFGAILEWQEWEKLGKKLKSSGVIFIIKPKVRFKGKPGEQGTFFVLDPSGNALEFKTFKSMDKVFATGK
ncbi:MAG: VOC family protein [Alphaproteobacteria bacterium]